SKATEVRGQLSFLPRNRIAIHRPSLNDAVYVAIAWSKNNYVVLLVQVGLFRDVLGRDVVVRHAHLIERDSPPAFVLRALPRVHDSDARSLDEMRFYGRSGRNCRRLNAKFGRDFVHFIHRSVADDESAAI